MHGLVLVQPTLKNAQCFRMVAAHRLRFENPLHRCPVTDFDLGHVSVLHEREDALLRALVEQRNQIAYAYRGIRDGWVGHYTSRHFLHLLFMSLRLSSRLP